MLLGLMSRAEGIVLPEFFDAYSGDTLWALMVYWLVRAFFPWCELLKTAFLSACFAYAIEFSQFYHAPWIDDIRSSVLGGLVLGFGFKLSDLACYSVGILLGYALDRYVLRKHLVSGA